MKRPVDQIVGAVALAAGIAIALESRTFHVGFYTDPLGAGGLPSIAAALMAVGGALLLLRPRLKVELPSLVILRKSAIVVLCLLLYTAVLPFVGFLTATASAVAAFSIAFGGPIKRSLLLATGYTVVLYALFSYLLDLPLPIGSLFIRGS